MLEAIVAYKESIGLLNILKISGLSLLVLAGLYFSLKGTSVLFRRVIDRKLKARKERLFKWLKIKSVNVIDQGKALKIALFIAKLSKYAIYAYSVIWLYCCCSAYSLPRRGWHKFFWGGYGLR